MRRKSTAKGSAENVMTLLRGMGYPVDDLDIHINFPGGAPVDGPSAGVAMAVVTASAITGRPVDGDMAVTGEVSVRGRVMPVGGVPQKVEAARRSGLTKVLVPRENRLERFDEMDMEIIPVDTLEEALEMMLLPGDQAASRQPAREWPLPLNEKAAASSRTEMGQTRKMGGETSF
jgi:Lon-like ATP-dependent protease